MEPLDDEKIHDKFVEMISMAQRTVTATHYTFDDAQVVAAYQEAAARGVVVRAVFDRGQSAGHSASKSQKDRLGVLCVSGVEMKVHSTDHGKSMCHQKCLVVDSVACLFGSANMTSNSRHNAHEFGLYTTHEAVVSACERKFEALWEKGTLITSELVESWKRKDAAISAAAASTGGP